jgi:hypothetical protein
LILIKQRSGSASHADGIPGVLGLPHYTTRIYPLRCGTCGQAGSLHISEDGQSNWQFATIGFIGLAVNRHNPPNSILRCNACSSPIVRVETPPQDGA